MDKSLKEKIRNIVAEIVEVEPAEVTDNADFVNDLGMDSMQALEIMGALEKELSVQIPEEYLGKISNLANLIAIADKITTGK